MDADWSVELGEGDPALEMPWSDPDGRVQYHDLRSEPEALLLIDEAARYRELGEFLVAMNSASSVFETAKCDVWSDSELSEAEEIFGGAMKLASYVDLIFRARESCFDFALHESVAERAVELMKRAPELSSAAEFIIRSCYYHDAPAEDGPATGFYFTFYLSGYGDDEAEARLRWRVGLSLVRNALLQVSAELSRTGRAR